MAGPRGDNKRREMMFILQSTLENKVEPQFLKKFVPKWVELSLPVNCGRQGIAMTGLQSSSMTVVDIGANKKSQGGLVGGQFGMGAPRAKWAASKWIKDQLGATSRERRSINKNGETALVREKRFLGHPGSGIPVPDFSAMSMGGPSSGGPAREISESAQMMNNLLMLSKLQKNNLAREYSTIRRQGSRYVGDRVSFGSGIYGDVYTGRRKREALAELRSSALTRTHSRKKRFFFAGEPVEGTAAGAPSFLSILTGADPYKRSELSRDMMRRSLGNTLMTFLPPGMHPPPGKDPADFLNSMAPLFSLPNSSPFGSAKTQNSNGLFGDSFPGKKRRKRSS